ncbi:hypothetical protein BJ742DRAFT_300062 [Cladochytrium replicatum]|nr:hypothetical protein BJ742DRAFT_300062 [Cladochytrium replicatum]
MPPKQVKKGSSSQVINDDRFEKVLSDPRFRRTRKDTKLTVDSRFSHMLTSEDFAKKATRDRYGRAVGLDSKLDELKKVYKSEESEKRDTESDDEPEQTNGDSYPDDLDSSMEDDMREDAVAARKYALARGGIVDESSDEDDQDISDEDVIDLPVGPGAEESIPRGDETRRFAVMNMDWDNIKSSDLMKVFEGVKPKEGKILSVKIYPSEFGKERMANEDKEGPPIDFKQSHKGKAKMSLIEEDDGEEDYDSIQLRKYQLERLRYYYAVVECDSVETAKSICQTCDGAEYERTSNFFDLRYIPDSMEFDAIPRDESFAAPSTYKPPEFTTAALQHTKVKLTWDQDDPQRVQLTRKRFNQDDLKDMDFQTFLASEESALEESEVENVHDDQKPSKRTNLKPAQNLRNDEEDDPETIRQKYRSLLLGNDSNKEESSADDSGEEMEITFQPGLTELGENLLKKKELAKKQKNESVFESYLRERKQKQKERKDLKKQEANSQMSESISNKKGTQSGKRKLPADNDESNHNKAELELLLMNSGDTADGADIRHFDAQSILKAERHKSKKAKLQKKDKNKIDQAEGLQESFDIDTQDPRFKDILQSHHFAIDTTNPSFKKTAAMSKLLEARRETKYSDKPDVSKNRSDAKISAATEQSMPLLSSLVASIKRKSVIKKSNK